MLYFVILNVYTSYFRLEKTSVLLLNSVIGKTSCSYLIPPSNIGDYLKLAEEILPMWISTIHLKGKCYVKVMKEMELSDIENVIEKAKKK